MAIVAREPEEKAMMATMMDASCVTGSIFISKANFIGGASGEGGDCRKGTEERVCKCARMRGRNRGQK